MTTKHVATKEFKCHYCEGKISQGSRYHRRPIFNGTRFTTARLHPECEEAHIRESIRNLKVTEN